MRKAATILLLLFGIFWALFIVPEIMLLILHSLGTGIEALLMGSFPGLMRSAMLFVWIIFLVYPISYALQEIQIGQWEIMLSNNVSTREMMFGMFIGKIPVYGLLVLFVAPIVLSPFAISLQVGYLGQVIMYLTVFFVAISTLFLSTLITTAIQAKLGESSRGNDIAKALAMVVAVVVLIPMYGLMYFADSMSAALGLDVFLLFPFTWGADIISWTIIAFNGVGIPANAFLDVLKLGATTDLLLLLSFTGLVVLVAYRSADRIFTFGAGQRTEKITTVGEENLFLKGVRRVFTGPFGALVANSIKEFSRKMQNVSRLLYGVVLSILLPVIMSYSVGNAPEEIPPEFRWLLLMIVIIMIGIMLSMITGVTFGGIGFLESKDQLWIIKSAPNGARKFANARLVESLLLAIPIAVTPSIFAAVVFGFGIAETVVLTAYAYWMTFGSVLLCIGITSINPAYENQKSSAFYVNTFASIFLILLSMMISFFLSFSILMITSNLGMFMVFMSTPLVIIGSIVYVMGVSRLSKADIS
jgi:hypothetical protein